MSSTDLRTLLLSNIAKLLNDYEKQTNMDVSCEIDFFIGKSLENYVDDGVYFFDDDGKFVQEIVIK